jgi:hypothetical protein
VPDAHIERLNKERMTPLDILFKVMLEGEQSGVSQEQYDAAVDAAPYCHPKLQAIAYKPVPDENREERRKLLAAIPYEKRVELVAILEAAQARLGVTEEPRSAWRRQCP